MLKVDFELPISHKKHPSLGETIPEAQQASVVAARALQIDYTSSRRGALQVGTPTRWLLTETMDGRHASIAARSTPVGLARLRRELRKEDIPSPARARNNLTNIPYGVNRVDFCLSAACPVMGQFRKCTLCGFFRSKASVRLDLSAQNWGPRITRYELEGFCPPAESEPRRECHFAASP
jgi:hypothetical protein